MPRDIAGPLRLADDRMESPILRSPLRIRYFANVTNAADIGIRRQIPRLISLELRTREATLIIPSSLTTVPAICQLRKCLHSCLYLQID